MGDLLFRILVGKDWTLVATREPVAVAVVVAELQPVGRDWRPGVAAEGGVC